MSRLLMQILVLAGAGLAAWAGWWLYDLGKVHGVNELSGLRSEHRTLQTLYDKAVSERNNLRDRVAILERSSQVDRQAAQHVREELGALQEELQAAREEIKFYRGIVSPAEGKQGLRIHNFTLSPGLQAGEYQYDLVLTQLQRNDKYAKGTVTWKITGKQDDEVSELQLAGVTQAETKNLAFRFRYFQHLTGVINLPENFVAHKVELTVKASGKKAPGPLTEVFDWPGAPD
jgi:hypothetical protein